MAVVSLCLYMVEGARELSVVLSFFFFLPHHKTCRVLVRVKTS